MMNMGQRLGIHAPQLIINEVQAAVAQWSTLARQAGVTRASIQLIASYLRV